MMTTVFAPIEFARVAQITDPLSSPFRKDIPVHF
jgi:hypothetical protein